MLTFNIKQNFKRINQPLLFSVTLSLISINASAVGNTQKDIYAFANQTSQRASSYQSQAQTLSDFSAANIDQYKDYALQMGQRSQAVAPIAQKEPGMMIFVSLGMPTIALRQIAEQAHHYGIPVMIQGFVQNDLQKTQQRILEILQPNNQKPIIGGYVIDPNWFKRYHITQVPAFVATSQTIPCEQHYCPAERYDVLHGNISVQHALEILSTKGECANIARKLLVGHKG